MLLGKTAEPPLPKTLRADEYGSDAHPSWRMLETDELANTREFRQTNIK